MLSDLVKPALDAGDYELIIRQQVQVQDEGQAGTPNVHVFGSSQRFRIDGPHLSLSPGTVAASRPAPGTSGSYGSWLPHVVLADPSLPWQIAPADPAPAPRGPDLSVNAPWLALLVLTRSEINQGGGRPGTGSAGGQVMTLTDLMRPPAGTVGPVGSSALSAALREQPEQACTVVDVDVTAFRAIAPLSSELPWLVHTRQVDPTEVVEFDVPAPGSYSLVVSNRLPVGADDNCYQAHLVSLEGCTSYLADSPAPSGANWVRLVSLTSWTFTSTTDPGDFAGLLEHVDPGPLALEFATAGGGTAAGIVSAALETGAVPLRYLTRFGDETVAWYRGPLRPGPLAENPQPPGRTSSAGLSYDETTGLFDVSYGAAWELGRLLTLANGPVTELLVRWARGLVRTARFLAAGLAAEKPGMRPRRPAARDAVAHLTGGIGQIFGPAGDPTGLRHTALPGLLDAEVLRDLVSGSSTPGVAVAEAALSAARSGVAAVPHNSTARGDPARPTALRTSAAAPTARRHDVVRSLLQTTRTPPDLVAGADPLPAEVASWLGRLATLELVPPHYLVPDSRLLPQESIRFFYVDPNWTAALTDGALSVARDQPSTAAVIHGSRDTLVGGTGPSPTYTGALLRSAAVLDWPNLKVSGYAGTDTAEPLPVALLTRLAPDCILVVFQGALHRLDVTEPAQHLHFGVGSDQTPQVALRWVDQARAGTQAADVEQPVSFRGDGTGRRVVDIHATSGNITTALTALYGHDPLPPFGSAALALQFLTAAQSQPFTVGAV